MTPLLPNLVLLGSKWTIDSAKIFLIALVARVLTATTYRPAKVAT